MIRFQAVDKVYDGRFRALNHVDIDIASGELVFLTGHSGAGKSTLLRLLSCVELPTSGRVMVDDEDLAELTTKEIQQYRRTIGMIYQDHKLLGDRTVFENTLMPLTIADRDDEKGERSVESALDRVGLLSQKMMYPHALSAGQQQRVGIARAIVARPNIILADEPTGNLDPALSDEIMSLFVELNQYGTTILVATHDLQVIRQFGARTIVLKNGDIIYDGLAS